MKTYDARALRFNLSDVKQAEVVGAPHEPVRVDGAPSIAVRFAARVEKVVDRGYVIEVHLVVADRDTGAPFPVQFNVKCPGDMRPRPVIIREAMRAALDHEVDESITVDGTRPFDPHANEPSSYITIRFTP